MKRVCLFGIIFCFTSVLAVFYHPMIIYTEEVKKPIFEPIDAQMIMDNLVTESQVETKEDFCITYDEAQMLMKIAMAEAEGDGIEGKAMVMAVVLNRVNDERFPDNIEDVIFQDKQFSPVKDGRYEKAEPDIECHLALAEIEKGNYSDVEALYFENASDSWQARNCIYLETVGHHRFYK